ncbi:MAG: class B sortase [Ruminococcus sp.]|nr:class B sortase [Ruminococcus sp.]
MRKRNNFLPIMLIIISSIAIVGTGLYIIVDKTSNLETPYYNGQNTTTADSTLNSTAPVTEITAPSVINEKEKENPFDFTELQEQNPDIYAWIYIPNTKVNYPVCKSNYSDNYYLDHDIYKNYSFSGAIYSQECNGRDFSDPVTVLYGHNMADGSMFHHLHKFEDKDFFDKNRYIYVYTADRKLTYEVVSAFIYDSRHIMNTFDFSKESDIKEYFDTVTNPRSLTQNVVDNYELTTSDKILTLSTCVNYGRGRYLVQGALIKDEFI